jgi:hypothetical protein
MDRPTLYLTNWSSRRTPGMFGPGRAFTMMARPRWFERGEGTVNGLTPSGDVEALLGAALAERRAGVPGVTAAFDAYRAAWDARSRTAVAAGIWGFGGLWAQHGDVATVLRDGDTVACACSREDAAKGRCHRAFVAPFLVRAGWRVILDGVEVSDG